MSFIPDQAFFEAMAHIAAAPSLSYFRTPLLVENKATQGFDPVTQADRQTEHSLRDFLRAQRSQDGIIGEEWGAEGETQDYVWVIDPIDGTRAYVAGLPSWGTLVGLMFQGRAVAGMMAQPYNGDLFFANEKGSFFTRLCVDKPLATPQKLSVRQTTELAEASLFTTTPGLFDGTEFPGFCALRRKVRQVRFGGDCYAFALLAAGLIDLVIEVGLQNYDIVALIPIIEQAGGVVSCFDGSRAESGGNIIAAATPQLHSEALEFCR